MMVWPIRQLGRMISEMSKAGVSIDRVAYIMDSPVEQDEPDCTDAPMDGDICFEHVNFGYENSPQILHDIHFTMKAVEGSSDAVTKDNQKKRERATALREAQVAAVKQAIAEQLQNEEADPTLWSKSRMERIAFKADGSAAGPFICTLSDGQKFRVLAIQGIQDNVAVFELEGSEPGKAGPVMRFPYERIHGMDMDSDHQE